MSLWEGSLAYNASFSCTTSTTATASTQFCQWLIHKAIFEPDFPFHKHTVDWWDNTCMECSTWPSQSTWMELGNHATKCSQFNKDLVTMFGLELYSYLTWTYVMANHLNSYACWVPWKNIYWTMYLLCSQGHVVSAWQHHFPVFTPSV
jgi:hypothetical protein